MPCTPQYGRCFFIDVGQGTANIILLKKKRAIVLDAGPPIKNSPVYRILSDVDVIETVVFSHNDKDHIGGWVGLLTSFYKKIREIWCVVDADCVRDKRLDVIVRHCKDKKLVKPKRAEVEDLRKPRPIWKDTESPLRLELWYPDFSGNYNAIVDQKPNRSSVICCLRYGDEAIVFPGDSEIDAWKQIADVNPRIPKHPAAIAVPHHAGLIGADDAELHWLFGEIIIPQVAVISVGSANTERHPRPEVIKVLRDAGARIICTQITPQCHNDLEALRPGVLKPEMASASSAKPMFTRCQRRSKHVACAGTVAADLCEGLVRFGIATRHEALVRQKVNNPLCVAS